MFFASAVAIALAIRLAVLVVQAVIVWLAIWWFGFEAPEELDDEDQPTGSRLVRVLMACVVNGLVVLGISASGAVADLMLDDLALNSTGNRLAGLQQGLPIAMLIAQLPVAWVCLRNIVRLRWSDAAIATMVLLLSGHVLNIPGRLAESALGGPFRITSDNMAPALCGVHAEITCPNCGFRHPYSMRDRLLPEAGRLLAGNSAVCPNCGQEAQTPRVDHVYNGDRVMLRKTQRPLRGDVVMFEWMPSVPESNPAEKQSPKKVSLVERVIGLPGETVEICLGDVFINGRRLQKSPHESPEMWSILSDSRCDPTTPVAHAPRWEPVASNSRWKKAGTRWICAEGTAPDSLWFTGRLADLLSYYGRDAAWTPQYDDSAPLIGDIRLQCELGDFQGAGSLTFEWEFRGQKATATVAASGSVELVTSETLDPVRAPMAGGLIAGASLTFAVRDGRVYVMRDDTVVASANVGPQEIESVKSRLLGVKAEPCMLRITAARASMALSRIVLARDVYYRSTEELSADPGVVPHGTLNHPCTVSASFYYLLGDHSERCLDSRILGNVPSKEILGVVKGVFWPMEHWRGF